MRYSRSHNNNVIVHDCRNNGLSRLVEYTFLHISVLGVIHLVHAILDTILY